MERVIELKLDDLKQSNEKPNNFKALEDVADEINRRIHASAIKDEEGREIVSAYMVRKAYEDVLGYELPESLSKRKRLKECGWIYEPQSE